MRYGKKLFAVGSLASLKSDFGVHYIDGLTSELEQIVLEVRRQFHPFTIIKFQFDLAFHLDLPLFYTNLGVFMKSLPRFSTRFLIILTRRLRNHHGLVLHWLRLFLFFNLFFFLLGSLILNPKQLLHNLNIFPSSLVFSKTFLSGPGIPFTSSYQTCHHSWFWGGIISGCCLFIKTIYQAQLSIRNPRFIVLNFLRIKFKFLHE